MELEPKRPIVKGPSDWSTDDVWVETPSSPVTTRR